MRKIRLKTEAKSQHSEQLISTFHFPNEETVFCAFSMLYTQVSVGGLPMDILYKKETKDRDRLQLPKVVLSERQRGQQSPNRCQSEAEILYKPITHRNHISV